MKNFKTVVLSILLFMICSIVFPVTVLAAETPEVPISYDGIVRNYKNGKTTNVNLRALPSLNSNVLTMVKVGDSVRILDQEGEWFKVDYQGTEGYIFWKYVSFVEAPIDLNSDILGNSIIHYTSSANRDTNISIACNSINDIVLQPGERFSWLDVVGNTTADKGYLKAPIILNGKTTLGFGGGVCQVATTLFNALDDTTITPTERSKHSKTCAYAEKDATVSFSSKKNFAFINTYDFPIKIIAKSYKATVFIEICKVNK